MKVWSRRTWKQWWSWQEDMKFRLTFTLGLVLTIWSISLLIIKCCWIMVFARISNQCSLLLTRRWCNVSRKTKWKGRLNCCITRLIRLHTSNRWMGTGMTSYSWVIVSRSLFKMLASCFQAWLKAKMEQCLKNIFHLS